MDQNLKLTDYIKPNEFENIRKFSEGKRTPFLLINLKRVEQRYDELIRNLPFAKIFYAVKSNPSTEIIQLLEKKGSNFDVATIYEIDKLINLGISPERMSFGNTIKKEEDIAHAYKKGIRLFATDSLSDLMKLSRQAPGSKVFFRILCNSSGADWPLSKKFGAHPDMIYHLILDAKALGLVPYGLSFHVGSQQRDIGQWDDAVAQCKYLFHALKEQGVELKMINLGGGFPSTYIQPTKDINTYAKEITRFLKEDFGENLPEIIIEPGRSLVGDSGVIVSEVVMISKKAFSNDFNWVYFDVGKFGGLIETLDECIKYPIFTGTEETVKEFTESVIAGPTCDSMDILYEKFRYKLPENLREGDKVFILTTGAYTSSYSSVEFNGIPPLKVYVVEDFEKL